MAASLEATELTNEFKNAMRRLVSTISIITAAHNGEWSGMAATAVSAVSLDPPSLVIGVNRNASLHHPISAGNRFCVNLLNTSHSGLVHPFSGKLKGAERFGIGVWKVHETGIPYLEQAMVNFFCKVDAQLDYGTHTLFIGLVEAVHIQGEIVPLLWQDGGFAATAPMESDAPASE